MDYQWHDLLGNIGVVCILGAYLLLHIGKLAATDLTYSLVNGAGAALILVSLTYDFNMSAFIVEAAWLGISVFGVALYITRVRS